MPEIMRGKMRAAMERSDRTLPERLLEIPRECLYWDRDELFSDCRALQTKILREILSQAEGSVYGQTHGISGKMTPEAYQNQVPISTYGDYLPYITAECEQGEANQLYHADTEMVVATTGSTGKMKLFLESAAGNAAKLLVMAIRGMYMSDVLPITRDNEAKNLTISNYEQLGHTPSGKPILRASGQTARNLRKKSSNMNILTVDFWETAGLTAGDRDYLMAVFALSEIRLSKIFCNNLIHFGRLLDLINARGAEMIADLRKGAFSLPLPAATKARLDGMLVADPARADLLQSIWDRQGKLFATPEDIHAVWPQCRMASCWLSGSVGRDAREVLARMPKGIKCFDMGYGASEGKLNVPMKLACSSGAAAVFSVFYEFRPLTKGVRPLFMWEVEDGAYYELIITTYSGLYRYNMLDVVRIDGFFGDTPNIVFCGKSTEYVTVDGQRLYSYEISDLIFQLEQARRWRFDVMQVTVENGQLMFVLGSGAPVDYQEVFAVLDDALRQRWHFGCGGLYVTCAAYKTRAFDARVRDNRGACGIKLPIVLTAPPKAEDIAQFIPADSK